MGSTATLLQGDTNLFTEGEDFYVFVSMVAVAGPETDVLIGRLSGGVDLVEHLVWGEFGNPTPHTPFVGVLYPIGRDGVLAICDMTDEGTDRTDQWEVGKVVVVLGQDFLYVLGVKLTL